MTDAIYYQELYGERVVVKKVPSDMVKAEVDLIVECWNIDNKNTGKVLDDVKHKYKDYTLIVHLYIS